MGFSSISQRTHSRRGTVPVAVETVYSTSQGSPRHFPTFLWPLIQIEFNF